MKELFTCKNIHIFLDMKTGNFPWLDLGNKNECEGKGWGMALLSTLLALLEYFINLMKE